ncbi:MAG: U32 family peptidase [Desulfovibrionaceae bacterium]
MNAPLSTPTGDTPLETPLILPEILAPAGDGPSFLAALAAGADAVYLGLKHFSARMQAENFGATDLSRLVDLAHKKERRVYVAMNTLVKADDLTSAYHLVARLERDVHPDALIVQDLAMLSLAQQAGFSGELHLSTLANITHPSGLVAAHNLGAHRVILPRELSIDEIKVMSDACPEGLCLETFVHGALCYCVSGRCYWSSYMGGKSGLRGRCVQPCRRVYRQGGKSGGRDNPHTLAKAAQQAAQSAAAKNTGRGGRAAANENREARASTRPLRSPGKPRSGRYFSCLDLSLDVLAKTLLEIPHLHSWKIEGRKKGPHYVFHVVTAYRMLRDNPHDPKVRKTAEGILAMALGRIPTRARFLPQHSNGPTAPDDQTSSGLLIGKVSLSPEGVAAIKTRIELLPQDYLRIGVEDESWHTTLPVTKGIPKAGTLMLRLPKHKTPKAGTSVYLIDRREPALMQILRQWEGELSRCKSVTGTAITSAPTLPTPIKARKRPDILVRSTVPMGRETKGSKNTLMALWLAPKAAQELSRTIVPKVSWWLPPVIWPEEEPVIARLVHNLIRNGAKHFVCNSPWQMEFFRNVPGLDVLAGPFCNVANPTFIAALEKMGFTGAFVSPELPRAEFLALPRQSSLALGMVISGFWPVGISRFGLSGIKPNEPFASPKGEVFWARNYGPNLWLYPAWPLDLTEKRPELENAGYSFFAHLQESPPAALPEVRRAGLFNWEGELL